MHRQIRYLTDRAGGVADLRHLENTGMSHLNPEAEKTQTQLVPGILQDAEHTPKSLTRLKTRAIGRMRLAPLAFKA